MQDRDVGGQVMSLRNRQTDSPLVVYVHVHRFYFHTLAMFTRCLSPAIYVLTEIK